MRVVFLQNLLHMGVGLCYNQFKKLAVAEWKVYEKACHCEERGDVGISSE